MTYDELRTILRRDLLAEASTDYFTEADLLSFLKRAAVEIARDFGFPTAMHTQQLPGGATEAELPEDVADAQLAEVAFSGFRLTPAPLAVIAEYQELGALRFPRHYNVDPKRDPRRLYFAPPVPSGGGRLMIEYVVEYDTASETETSAPWGSRFARFHGLVAYRAAVNALEASMESDRAAALQQRLMPMMQSFALFLGKADLARAMAGEGAAAT